VATLALAQDNAFGQPLESQLRSCVLAGWMCDAMGVDREVRDTSYWVALLRYIGCTGHAHEVATLFGDEIAIRAQTLVHDAANPPEVIRDVIEYATAGRSPEQRDAIVALIQTTAPQWAVHNFTSGCEVGDMLLRRLAFGEPVRTALAFTFERWNGKGYPAHAAGETIPLPMRLVHLTHDMEAIGRRFSTDQAMQAVTDRRGRTYDPALADVFIAHGRAWLERLKTVEPWDAVLAMEPRPHQRLEGATLDEALLVAADFVDMKSPFMNGHSRRCAQLVVDTARVLGLPDAEVTALRQAALVHDLGTTAVPNSIWDKPGPLTRAEFDRVELHPLLTEQMLRRSTALAPISGLASAHHERGDGSGYHKRLKADAADLAAAVLAVAEVYVGLTADRADRPAHTPADAATELGRLEASGALDARACRAVLVAAGHGVAPEAAASRPRHPGGLSGREVEVLRLAARGLKTQTIADQLFISPKTADHHIQHIYTKIGVSTRAAAALWAMQHAVV